MPSRWRLLFVVIGFSEKCCQVGSLSSQAQGKAKTPLNPDQPRWVSPGISGDLEQLPCTTWIDISNHPKANAKSV